MDDRAKKVCLSDNRPVGRSTTGRLSVVIVLACALIVAACSGESEKSSQDVGSRTTAKESCEQNPVAYSDKGSTRDGSATTSPDIATAPEISTGYRSGMKPVRTATFVVAAAHPLATKAACEVLADGGTAADALVVAQTVLGLVEPQSSGLGGGGFVIYYDAESGTVRTYDGRETAPGAATGDYLRWVDQINRTAPIPDTRSSGRAIGVPGVVRLLETVQNKHGTKTWASLFNPAIQLSKEGFEISPRLADSIAASSSSLARDQAAAGYFLDADGSPKTKGEVLSNPDYASTLEKIAKDGANAFYTGPIANLIVEKATSKAGGTTPSLMTADDLKRYEVIERDPICTPYRESVICGMPPPSSGGIAVAQTLGILSYFEMSKFAPTEIDLDGGRPTVDAVHLISEAERLAYADRDAYVADTDFVPLPLSR